MTSPHYGRHPLARSRNPFTCGLTGKTYTHDEFSQRLEALARAVAKRLSWQPNEETEWDKVACMFAFNTVRYPRPFKTPHPMINGPPPRAREQRGLLLLRDELDDTLTGSGRSTTLPWRMQSTDSTAS